MSKILHIEASPRGEHSSSSRLARYFLGAYLAGNDGDSVETLNVCDTELPAVTADVTKAKFARIYGEEINESQQRVWSDINERIRHFDSFDKIILSSPMWNYSVPYPLKHYIDIIMQPGITFGYDPEKMVHIGLLQNRPVQLLLTRSSVPPGDYGDFQLPYLRFVLGAMGLRDLRVITAWQTTRMTPEERTNYIESFEPECQAHAAAF